jgi:hypothetical protein
MESPSLSSTAITALFESTSDSQKIISLFHNFILSEKYDDLYKTIKILLNQYNGSHSHSSSATFFLKMLTLNTGIKFKAHDVNKTMSLGKYVSKVYDAEFGEMFEKRKEVTIDCVYNILCNFSEGRNMQNLHHHFLLLDECTIAYIVNCLTGKSTFSTEHINHFLKLAFYDAVSQDERGFATFYRETFSESEDYEFEKNETTERKTERYITQQITTAYAKCTNYKTILTVMQRNGLIKGLAKLSDECKIVLGNPVILPEFRTATVNDKLSFEGTAISCAPFPFGIRSLLHFRRDAGIRLYNEKGDNVTNELHKDTIGVIINCLSDSEELITCMFECMFTVEKTAKNLKRKGRKMYNRDDDDENDEVGDGKKEETPAAKNKVFVTDLLFYNSEDYTCKTLAERKNVLFEKVITREISNEFQLIRYEDDRSSFEEFVNEQKNSISCRGFVFKGTNEVYPIGNSSWIFVKTNHLVKMNKKKSSTQTPKVEVTGKQASIKNYLVKK